MNISEPICEAVNIFMDAKVAKLKFDRTVRATIYNIISLDSGIYRVKFEGSVFTAYAEDVQKQYKTEEEVYVRIPEGDFSNKKTITGRVTEQSLSQGLLIQLTNSDVSVSPTFDNFYSFNKNAESGEPPWKVAAGGEKSFNYICGSADKEYDDSDEHNLFQQYANKYENIKIKADFKTLFHAVHTQGNYGIEIAFFAKSKDSKTDEESKDNNPPVEVVIYKLDFQSFVGNPYSLSVFSPQLIIIKTLTNYLLGLKYIRLFQENFATDERTEYDVKEKKIKTFPVTNPNIFVLNIQISYVDVKDLTKEPYYCYIATPKGNIIKSGEIDLEARLLSYGELVNNEQCKYKWFKRDLSILIGDELYDSNAGFGWALMEDKTKSSLTINSEDVNYQLRYKCIVTYDDKMSMTAEEEVLNLSGEYEYHIDLITEGNIIKLLLVNDKKTGNLTGMWYVSYPDGSYSAVLSDKTNYILIEDYLIYTSVVFYCEVYDENITGTNKVVGTIEHTVFSSGSKEDLIVRYIGEDAFRYDANGDVSIEDSEKDRTMRVEVTWKAGYGSNYRLEWIGPDGKLVPIEEPTEENDRYKNSMVKNVWVDNRNILHYNIKLKYRMDYNNNVFTLKIITIDEKVYTFNKEILFMKNGDLGTNGTTYFMAVRPCDSSGNKLSGFLGLWYDGSLTLPWRDSLRLKCYVYKDGDLIHDNEEINNSTKYNIAYKWEPIGVDLFEDEDQDAKVDLNKYTNFDQVIAVGKEEIPSSISEIKENAYKLQRYVKVSAEIKLAYVSVGEENSEILNKTVIHALYPIDVLYSSKSEEEEEKPKLEKEKIDISSLPSYIKYTASGINPLYYRNDIKWLYDNNEYTYDEQSSSDETIFYITSLIPEVLDVELRDKKLYLRPAPTFIFEEDTIGVIQCKPASSDFIIHPVIMYLDTYGNEAINGWDGTKLSIDDDGTYIFAPLIGAGEKDESNKFTGIVMGKDSSLDKIGLYGYEHGANTFGFMQNGAAYLGAPGDGLILFNIDSEGNKLPGVITSGNYDKEKHPYQGMLIMLYKGHIDAYNFKISSKNMTLDSQTGSFEFRLRKEGDNNDEDTSRISNSKFRIFFPPGTYKGKDENYPITINEDDGKNVFYIDKDEYYLQTLDYVKEDVKIDEEGKETLIQGKGTRIDILDGKITSYNFHISTPTLNINSNYPDSHSQNTATGFSFDVSQKGLFDIYTINNNKKKNHLFYVRGSEVLDDGTAEEGKYYLQSENYKRGESGTKIDLEEGKIISYNFNLDTPYVKIKSIKPIENNEQENIDLDNEVSINVYNSGIFKIYWDNENSDNHISNKLIYIEGVSELKTDPDTGEIIDSDEGRFYLLSYDYTTTDDGTEGKGMKINLVNGKINAYSFYLKTPSLTIDSNEEGGTFRLNVNSVNEGTETNDNKNNGKFVITGKKTIKNTETKEWEFTKKDVDLITISNTIYSLESSNYKVDNDENDDKRVIQGLKMDLRRGKILAGGDIEILGTIKASKGKIGGWRISESGLSYKPDDKTYPTFILSTSGKGSLYIGSTGLNTSSDNNNENLIIASTDSYLRYSNGSLNISGDIRANNLHLRSGNTWGNSILVNNPDSTNDYQIGGEYINCRGLKVGTPGNNNYFEVTSSGEVKIRTLHFTMVTTGGETITPDSIGTTISSSIETKLNEISLTVLRKDMSGKVIDGSSITLGEGIIDIGGVVSFEDLETKGKTVINGGNIITNSITADAINTSTITDIGSSTNKGLTLSAMNLTFEFGNCDFNSDQDVYKIHFPKGELILINGLSLPEYIKSFIATEPEPTPPPAEEEQK